MATEVRKLIDEMRPELKRGAAVTLRGQVQTMHSSFKGLAFGLAIAIVLVYLLIVVNPQSWLVLAASSAATLWVRRTHAEARQAAAQQQIRNHVYTVKAKNGAGSVSFDLPGTLLGLTEAPIGARTSGYVFQVLV